MQIYFQDLRKSRTTQYFSLSTALRIGTQCLEGLEELHVNSFLHRDVKPGNYAMGRAEDNASRIVYIIDFGELSSTGYCICGVL